MADFLKYGNAIRLAQLATDPASPENGLMYYNTVSNVIRQYINGGWEDVSAGSVALVGQALNEAEIIVGDSSDLSAAVDTSAAGDILADSVNGLTIKAGVIVNADIAAAADIARSKLAAGNAYRILANDSAGEISENAAITAARAVASDANGQLVASATTATELGYVNGVTSSIQDQLDDKASAADVSALITLSGVAAGETDLGAFTGSIIPDDSDIKEALQSLETFVEAIPSPFYYAGVWAASTNTPTLDDTDTGVDGAVYYVTDSGTVDFGAGPQVFNAGDKVANNGTTWDKWDMTDSVVSVNSQTGVVVLDTGDIAESGNLYFTDERAQDAVGTIFADTASIELIYTDATPEITANVIPGGVDHDALLNYVANEHVDHSAVQIATAANTSGLSGGGNITATRNLAVDINGTTAETSADNADKVLIYDNSATALKSMTRANFLAGIAISSPGDINESSFAGLADNTADQVITGFAFNNATVRSFKAQVSIIIDATADLYATYELMGIQKAASWDMSQSYTGDNVPDMSFNITSAGQVRVTVGTIAGFVDGLIKFRAQTTSV